MLFTVKCGKFKLSVQGRDLAPLFGNGTKLKIPSEIKLPLAVDKKSHRSLTNALSVKPSFSEWSQLPMMHT